MSLTTELQIDDATLTVAFVSQRERDQIAQAASRRLPGQIVPETDVKRRADMYADALIVGWRNLSPLDALGWGYLDYEKLPTNGDGSVVHGQETARALFSGCLWEKFAAPIEECARQIAEQVAREKKRASARSSGSPAPTG